MGKLSQFFKNPQAKVWIITCLVAAILVFIRIENITFKYDTAWCINTYGESYLVHHGGRYYRWSACHCNDGYSMSHSQCLLPLQADQRNTEINTLMTDGKILCDQGEVQAGIAKIKQVITLNSHEPFSYSTIGYCYQQATDLPNAEAWYEKALTDYDYKFGPNFEGHYYHDMSVNDLPGHSDYIPDYQFVDGIKTSNREAIFIYKNLAKIYFERNNPILAMLTINKAFAWDSLDNPVNAESYFIRGNLYLAKDTDQEQLFSKGSNTISGCQDMKKASELGWPGAENIYIEKCK
ncbi:hypothetical protein IPF86_01390 [Candidatus Nomurabacteria bacterium]|jgi:tetratricopeptide (TPR) repeat protein|nr:MAG: hypothetical protein IPF86_01390 [Candidatus Nomurabacteria bacterium]